MGDVIDFPGKKVPEEGPRGCDILTYIQDHIDFEISFEVYVQIDRAVAQVWNDLPVGEDLHATALFDAIRALRKDGILFSDAQIQTLSNLFLDALESGGFVEG